MTLIQLFKAIADAIRLKKGTEDKIKAEDFPSAIESITTTENLEDVLNAQDEKLLTQTNKIDEIINSLIPFESQEQYITQPRIEMGDISREGVLSDSTSYCRTSDYVYVNGKTSLVLNNGTANTSRITCYNSNKEFITNWNGTYSYKNVSNGSIFEIPEGCYYIKARFESNTIGTLVINYI